MNFGRPFPAMNGALPRMPTERSVKFVELSKLKWQLSTFKDYGIKFSKEDDRAKDCSYQCNYKISMYVSLGFVKLAYIGQIPVGFLGNVGHLAAFFDPWDLYSKI
jgi:hypothetical protein